MMLFVGLDISLEKAAVCVISEHGKIVKEAQVASEPEALLSWISDQDGAIAAVGLEAGPLSQWRHRGLSEAGLPVVLMETRQVKGAPRAMPIKTDRRDAEGIARLLHLGWFRPVHCKSVSAQEVRAVLNARKDVQQGFITLEMSLRGLLWNFGLKVGTISRGRFEQVYANWRPAIRCWRRPPNPCSARGARCGKGWRALNAMYANSPMRIRSVAD